MHSSLVYASCVLALLFCGRKPLLCERYSYLTLKTCKYQCGQFPDILLISDVFSLVLAKIDFRVVDILIFHFWNLIYSRHIYLDVMMVFYLQLQVHSANDTFCPPILRVFHCY